MMPVSEREREKGAIPVQGQIRALFEALGNLTAKIVDLEKSFEGNDEEVREILASVSSTVQALRTIIYGNQDFRLTGIADRIQNIETDVRGMIDARRNEKLSERFVELEKSVTELVEARKSLLDQLKGMKIALGLMGITGGGTLITVILELLKP
jgi:uncharacterized protein YlxW (UPF0749 family)